jgi:peptidoglycan hydrolase-like protein with peptidoglycan-binding domain
MRDAEFDYRPDPMGRLGYGVWRQEARRDPFGRLPEDEDEPLADLRRRWSSGERLENDSSVFELGDSVGEAGVNDRLDVAKVQIALHNEGRFDLDRSGGPTGYFSPPLAEAIRNRQADHDLTVDGYLEPAGETIASLRTLAEERTRDSLSVRLPARPGERPGGDRPGPSADIQLAGNPAVLAPAGAAAAGLVRWLFREGARRYAERAAKRAAESLATTEAQTAMQVARSAASASASSADEAVPSTAATGAQGATKQEPVTQDAVRKWLDAGFAGLALPMAGSRGSDDPTQKALDILAQECRDVANSMWPEAADAIEHKYGSTKDGDGISRQSEMVIKDKTQKGLLGSNKPDQSWWRKSEDPKLPESYFHINSGRTLVDAVSQTEGLVEKVGASLVYFVRKPPKGFDEADYRAYAREKCIEIMTDQLGPPTQAGSLSGGK